MRLLSIGFLLGIYCLQNFSDLPLKEWGSVVVLGLIFSPIALTLLWKLRLIIGFYAGFLYAILISTAALETRISPELEGQDLIVSGLVASIPYQRKNGWRFRLNIQSASVLGDPGQKVDFKGTLRLGWYRTKHRVKAGEKWQMVVRLKRPSGFMNPGGFDYEKWLFQEGIVATGYVRQSDHNFILKQSSAYSINAVREKILRKINQLVDRQELAAVVSALAVADRSAISEQQWELFRQTGTNHLVAISGLHIGMVAGFGFFPIMLIWWLFPRFYQKVPVKIAGGVVGGCFAISYALLAGFTLPTQRALIMVLVVLVGLIIRRKYSGFSVLATALLLVLLFDPLAVLSQGLWLSFIAVALIMMTLARRLKRQKFEILTIQFALSLGMLPLTLALFGTGSLSSPVANLLAIPWVTVVVVPVTLLGVLLMPFESVSGGLLNIAATSIDLMMQGLSFLSSSKTVLTIPEIPDYLLVLAFIGFLWLWLPAKFPARWLGLVLMLPLVTYRPDAVENGSFEFHLLDVGQGLASVVQTANHVLIYDTGPRSNSRFDTGKLVMLPFLRAKDIKKVDIMVISHEDMDHRGGAEAIREKIQIGRILSSDTSLFPEVENCKAGMKWTWDDVHFEVLHPQQGWEESDNNISCVLRVSNQHHSLLLTGDIEKKAEKAILNANLSLASKVMLIPHHGSKTSSHSAFLNKVQPQLALLTTGYRNQFHHPNAQVLKRYQVDEVEVLDTVEQGAISIVFPVDDGDVELSRYRQLNRRYWHRD